MTLRLTEGELRAIQQRHAGFNRIPPQPEPMPPQLIRGAHTKASKKAKAKAEPKGMNKWEAQFAETLKYKQHAGEIVWWAFEPFRIRLADGCFYRPDFASVDTAGRTSIYEVKGHFREAARVRLKVATEKLPYAFYLVKKTKNELRVTPL